MANILVNGLKSKAGGGKVILDTYLRLLVESAPADHYFILTPDRDAYRHVETDRIRLVDIPSWAHSNLATIPLYRVVLPRLLKRHRINAILNFGDIVIPTDVPQLYNFDWAFAVYPDHMSWRRLSRAEKLLYRVKLHYFEAYLPRATIIMAQTEAMKARLEARYRLGDVVLVPAAAAVVDEQTGETRFDLPDAPVKLVYPANYYPHKNIEVLEEVADLLKARGSGALLVTTLAHDEHGGARAFLDRVAEKRLNGVLFNVGRVASADMPSLYRVSDGLLMPTLLETFGLPYVEAMHHQKPILTSDLDFAHAVCGDAAIYFDPLDPQSIVAAIERLFADDDLRRAVTERGRERLRAMWDWPDVFAAYQRLIGSVLRDRSSHEALA